MSIITELLGQRVLDLTLPEVKEEIKNLPPVPKGKSRFLLQDYAAIKGVQLTKKDIDDVTE